MIYFAIGLSGGRRRAGGSAPDRVAVDRSRRRRWPIVVAVLAVVVGVSSTVGVVLIGDAGAQAVWGEQGIEPDRRSAYLLDGVGEADTNSRRVT